MSVQSLMRNTIIGNIVYPTFILSHNFWEHPLHMRNKLIFLMGIVSCVAYAQATIYVHVHVQLLKTSRYKHKLHDCLTIPQAYKSYYMPMDYPK